MSRGRALTLFALCAAALVAVMAWLTLTVSRLENAERRGRDEAALEETVRLALWRMESQLAPLLAQESARPYYVYDRTFPARLLADSASDRPELARLPIVSPLAGQPTPFVRLHYQWDGRGRISSPQSAEPNREGAADRDHDALAAARRLADPATLAAGLSSAWVLVTSASVELAERRPSAAEPQPAAEGQPGAQELRRAQEVDKESDALRAARSRRQEALEKQKAAPQARDTGADGGARLQQEVFSKLEFQARAASNTLNVAPARALPNPVRLGSVEVRVGPLQPLWAANELLLARRVRIGEEERVQVCWLDWPALRRWLLAGVSDLLPAAELVPVAAVDGDEPRRLAALPVRLLPGAAAPVVSYASSRLWLPLAAAWGLALLSLAASAALLHGSATLSERRAAFVSAVTHELRTPLTTFRIYSDMLLAGMVREEEQKRQYLATLSREAERQSHLVENVLAYSRLERGRYAAAREELTVGELIAGLSDSLAAHAEQSGMSLVAAIPETVRDTRVRVDRSAIERILFNLVDNAGKYARGAADRRIHLDGESDARTLRLTVRDHGPGLDPREARRLFRPFHKSARDAAQSAPGVGLGLALSRRLARALGGDLSAAPSAEGGGIAFCLRLPVVSP